jgi:hypothetical protein
MPVTADQWVGHFRKLIEDLNWTENTLKRAFKDHLVALTYPVKIESRIIEIELLPVRWKFESTRKLKIDKKMVFEAEQSGMCRDFDKKP